ncbi:MAG: HlyD family efflux transporter periplasmic adaptor subunit [Rhodocyclaceae bacterium]|nr:HlyD family efflux transporter periplasmic adaptor subunit [Rhodocyclaceae bacterium]MCA3169075.1 HlyD family efflux transporter periplasmic adaptor subunit [Burkholderiales bacterium]MCA3019405.1 HlyD family efflux transporter periplasmic adaptor subunit [Rhodocyclaceae bacterium]MCA3030820.1 HlyD family efflux transporter periplasmic adaptor subunit [Rhodocyclaceae bacterium]MCA3038318.1 HlyD family efflux transporter periplasmic adaptor subunit [Rhodocyclaceae bacterium]
MDSPLFRPESIEHQRERLFGEALVVWPVTFKIVLLCAVLTAVTFASFVTWGEYTRKARVSGYVVPSSGFVKVYAREVATITARRVSEGDKVKKGDVLFLLAMDRSGVSGVGAGQVAAVETGRRREALLQEKVKLAAIGRSQTDQIEKRIVALSDEYAKIDREIDLQRQRVETFRKTSDRYKQLVADNFISANQLQQQTGLQLEQELLLSSLERNKLSISREISTARQQIPEIAMRSQNDVSAVDRQLSALTQDLAEVDARRELVVFAPTDGIVTAIQAEPGQLATPTLPLLSVIPADAVFEARLLAPASAIGFIKAGNTVNLRYAAYPYQRFGHQQGTIKQVARTIVAPNELASPLSLQEPTYVVTVTLHQQEIKAYGEKHPLQAGMTLEADVLLDRRPIYQWVLEPLFSIKGRI